MKRREKLDYWSARLTAEELQSKTFAELDSLGFRCAKWLPLPDLDRSTRNTDEIGARLLAIQSVFIWVAFPEEAAHRDQVKAYIESNGLRRWLTEEEATIVAQSRPDARASYVDTIGWKLENMWPLAWVLGFHREPGLESSQIDQEVIQQLLYEFLPGPDGTIAGFLDELNAQPPSEVIAMEYRFYCAHNAVRSAQLGHDTVPMGFHPVIHGGAVHERRHSLSWCISPEVTWDETDLST